MLQNQKSQKGRYFPNVTIALMVKMDASPHRAVF